jgi:hypothetical protein
MSSNLKEKLNFLDDLEKLFKSYKGEDKKKFSQVYLKFNEHIQELLLQDIQEENKEYIKLIKQLDILNQDLSSVQKDIKKINHLILSLNKSIELIGGLI